MSLRFDNVPLTNQLGHLHNTVIAYLSDISPLKVDLILGIYRSEDGTYYLLPMVKKAQQIVLKETIHHNYLPVFGNNNFLKAACALLLGDIIVENKWKEGTVFSVQTVGGAGAVRIGADILIQLMKCTTAYHSDPSWENHRPILLSAGFKNIRTYRYLNMETMTLDFEGLCKDLSNAPSNSVIILHACGHNPTSVDPTKKQWKIIANIIKEQNLIPFFDITYQGLASGDVHDDSWVIRYFLQEGFEFLCAQSLSKTFTMYNERVGNLMFVLKSIDKVDTIKSHITSLVRSMYSNPPNHGAEVILKILTDPELYSEWLHCFKNMALRLKDIRIAFRKALEDLGAPGTWKHITDQCGVFIYLNLTDNQFEYLQKTYHVYMLYPGRINVTGLNKTNIGYVAKAIRDTLMIV